MWSVHIIECCALPLFCSQVIVVRCLYCQACATYNHTIVCVTVFADLVCCKRDEVPDRIVSCTITKSMSMSIKSQGEKIRGMTVVVSAGCRTFRTKRFWRRLRVKTRSRDRSTRINLRLPLSRQRPLLLSLTGDNDIARSLGLHVDSGVVRRYQRLPTFQRLEI
jgi:hypothetical protein